MNAAHDDSQGWDKFTYSSSDGLRLAGRKYGWQNASAAPVVCLAGLTRNSADFHELAMHLAYGAVVRRKVLSLDYRGRGMSERDSDWKNYNILTEADDVVAGMVAAGLESAAMVGTSRGGLIIHALAAMRPTLMRAVVFNDIGPEIDGRGLVRIKKYVENARDAETWQGAIELVSAIGHAQFPDYDEADWARQARRIFEEKNGRVVMRFDKRLVRGLAHIDLDNPLPSLWPQFRGLKRLPMMLVHGANSDLITADTIAKMKKEHPGMETLEVPGQGHAPDLGTAGVPERIETFLEALDKPAGQQ